MFHTPTPHSDSLYFQQFRYDYQRPKSPYKKMDRYNTDLSESGLRQDQYPVDLARHHIIPVDTLKNFFNTLLQNGDAAVLKNLWARLPSAINLYIKNNEFRDNITTSEANAVGRLVTQWSMRERPPFAENITPRDDLILFLLWAPGNLFVGPDTYHRSDDPGRGFENRSITILMNHSVKGPERFRLLSELYHSMTNYILNNSQKNLASMEENIIKLYVDVVSVIPLMKASWASQPASDGIRYCICPG